MMVNESISMVFFQEPAPMTEDLLEEQSEVLAKLGTSAEGTHLRARMQSACLLSDMESFKVRPANIDTFNLYMCCIYYYYSVYFIGFQNNQEIHEHSSHNIQNNQTPSPEIDQDRQMNKYQYADMNIQSRGIPIIVITVL